MSAGRPEKGTTTADPQTVVAALEAAGFTTVAVRAGVYVRMAWPNRTVAQSSLVVPLDKTAPEYDTMLGSLVSALHGVAAAGDAAHHVLEILPRP